MAGRTGVGATRLSPALRFCNSRQNRFTKGPRATCPAALFVVGDAGVAPAVNESGRLIAMLTPSASDFDALAARGFNLVPVCREIAADLETPVSAFLKIARGDYSFLLESVRGGEKWGRYTFLGSEPSMVLRARGDRTDIIRPGQGTQSRIAPNAFEELRKEVQRFKAPEIPGLPRFFGGAVGFLAYDIVRCFEPRIPARAHDDLGTPDLYMMFTESVLMFDNVRQSLTIIVNVAVNDFASPREGYEHAQKIIAEMIDRLAGPVIPPRLEGAPVSFHAPVAVTSNTNREAYMTTVSRAKEYITAGDIIQVVPSQRFEAPLEVHPFNIYRSLRTINPSPYMFYLRLGDHTIVGASPEVMVRVDGSAITFRPIAGTRPRGKTEHEDVELEKELLA